MHIELIGSDCPVLAHVSVGVQRAREVVDEHLAQGGDLHWTLQVTLMPPADVKGPCVHGRPGARFVYLCWRHDVDGVFRRAKLVLDAVPAELLTASEDGGLLGRFSLLMPDGSPLCAAVRPPRIRWTRAAERADLVL